jgi:hypothetical protein
MINGFHSGDSFHSLWCVLLNMFDQFGLCVGWSGNKHSTGIRNRLCDSLKIAMVFRCMTVSDGVRLMMDVFRRMIWMQDETFDVGWAKMENTGFSVIDPDDSMIVIVHEIDPSLFAVGPAQTSQGASFDEDPDDSMIVIVHEIDPSLLAVGPAQTSQGASFDEDDGFVSSILRGPVYGFPRYTFDW